MKVFISSVISELEMYRDAAEKAISMMGHKPIRSESLGARPYSSKTACHAGFHENEPVDFR